MDEFEDIRPYHDGEVRAVVQRLAGDADFLDLIGRYDSPRLARIAPRVVRYFARRRLGALLGDVGSTREFQQVVAYYVGKIVKGTMTCFSCTGVESLKPDTACLYISNHRDIAGDSMLVDFALHERGYDTVRIAVGDNLVQRSFATDLMKLNKSFLIRRSEVGTKKVYAAMLTSSRYIQQSLAEGQSVWIAQAEGRAKNGIDRTDPALLKMLALADRKRAFGEVLKGLNIVPVALSYEFDPCDVIKARELHGIATSGQYNKPAGEDLISLATGLGGFKGRVHLHFGDVITTSFETAEKAAEAIDDQILANLRLYPNNIVALRMLASTAAAQEYVDAWEQVDADTRLLVDSRFDARLASCPEAWRPFLLQMYANPVVNRISHGFAAVAYA